VLPSGGSGTPVGGDQAAGAGDSLRSQAGLRASAERFSDREFVEREGSKVLVECADLLDFGVKSGLFAQVDEEEVAVAEIEADAFGLFELAGDVEFLGEDFGAAEGGDQSGVGVADLGGDGIAGEAFALIELVDAGEGGEFTAFGLAPLVWKIEDDGGDEVVGASADDAVAGFADEGDLGIDVGEELVPGEAAVDVDLVALGGEALDFGAAAKGEVDIVAEAVFGECLDGGEVGGELGGFGEDGFAGGIAVEEGEFDGGELECAFGLDEGGTAGEDGAESGRTGSPEASR